MLTPADEVLYAKEKLRRGADLETIGKLLKAEWNLTDDEVQETLKAFFLVEDESI